VVLPLDPLPAKDEARRAVGLPEDALVVTAPGRATRTKRLEALVQAIARLRGRHPALMLVVAGDVEPGLPLAEWAGQAGLGGAFRVMEHLPLPQFVRHLVAADVVACLRFPSHGEISGAVVRAMGVGRPVLVSAGTPSAEEFPEGTVIPIDPGPHEAAELMAVLDRLLADPALREAVGRLAREHVRSRHDLHRTAEQLKSFLDEVAARKAEVLTAIEEGRGREGSLLEYLLQEVRYAAQDLGLPDLPPGVEPLVADLAGPR
jgi:glycosyltransferase involved in cell wall biosynthesis